jgi:peptidyl-prolyl cis-trans isomerase D
LDNYATYAGNVQTANAARVNNAVYTALKNKAEIEDNRSVFY